MNDRHRTPRQPLAALFLVSLAAGLVPARTASADPKTCIRSHANGQRESKAGHLRAASQLFTSCGSDDACPDQLRKECAEFLDAVKKTIPTVIFSALDEDGKDISGVKVYSNDELLVDGLDGRSFEIDPGKYHLRFVLPAGEPLSADVVVREAEKNRVIQVKKEKPAAPEVAAASGGAPAHHELGPAPWIAAGVAVAALGAGIGLGVAGSGKESDLDQCSPSCPDSMHATYSSAKGLLLGADIGFGVAIVSAGVATWLFVSGLNHDESAPATAPRPQGARGTTRAVSLSTPVVSYVPGGGVVGLSGKF
jgi:hypothetical protein